MESKNESRKNFKRWVNTLSVCATFLVAIGTLTGYFVGHGTANVIRDSQSSRIYVRSPGATSSKFTLLGTQLTVADDIAGGVWVRSSDRGESGTLPSVNHKPDNGFEWLVNGDIVGARCAQKGSAYIVRNDGKTQLWHWWVLLEGGGWIPTAVIAQYYTSAAPTSASNGPVLSICH